VYGGVKVYLQIFLPPENGDEWSDSLSRCFIPKERILDACVRHLVDLRASANAAAKKKFPVSAGN
jgi:hypothetical protein